MTSITTIYVIFALLFTFQVKHYLADFPLQTKYMLGKFSRYDDVWIPALLAHVAVHGAFTLVISLIYFCWVISTGFGTFVTDNTDIFLDVILISLSSASLDMAIHFSMDRIKASPYLLGKYKPDEKPFWLALGVDQTVHHLTHYALIAMLIAVTI